MLDYDDEFSTTMHNDIAIQQLNSILPKDIRAFSCNGNLLEYHEIDVRVSNGFNPHLNSFSRKYLYYLPIDLYHCIFSQESVMLKKWFVFQPVYGCLNPSW